MSVRKALKLALFALVMGLAGCDITPDGIEEKPIILDEVFPPSRSVASYRQIDKPKRMAEKDFADQIGGPKKLEILKAWGTFSTTAVEYGLPNQKPKVRISVSELPTKLEAYGAYTHLRPGLLPEEQYIKIGVHATLDGSILYCVHDRYLIVVHDLTDSSDEQRKALLINFARAVSERIPRPVTDIAPLIYLPAIGRVTASERLDKTDPLNLGIMDKGAVTAIYRVENREAKVFLAEVNDGFLKNGAAKKIRKLMEANGPVKELKYGDYGVQGQLFNKTAMVAQQDKVFFGAFGTLTEEEMKNLMLGIERRIKPIATLKYTDIQKNMDDQEKKDEKEAKEAETERKRQ